ncbi:MAG: UDP-N-acetylmuramate--L-alanine ligase [Lachnospiraceae bacterium]|nr:UDP-N-acetylmuramate--L-alanine ligase [Lachnospiraceae bacterium]
MASIDFNKPEWVHFIGIGGISMSGLAEILKDRGFKVTGSDMHASALTEKLESEGVHVAIGQRAENIDENMQKIVYTAAVHADNPELMRAKELGIPLLTRAELLGQTMQNYRTAVAVAGTHGKTTTTSMITEAALAAELDPTVSVGGMLDSIGGNIRIGQSDLFIAEACEYTNSFLSFFPTVGVILNVGADHLDFFEDLDDIRNSFRKFAMLLPEDGFLVISSNIEKYEDIVKDVKCRVITVGERAQDDYRMENITYDKNGCPSFTLFKGSVQEGEVALGVPGLHNAWNALAAAACMTELGADPEVVFQALKSFGGTHRRFEKKGILPGDVLVIDDYAHHPDEIRATLTAAKKMGERKVICIFQPHTYSRTKALLDEFADALSLADEVVLAKIYPARETDDLGISSNILAEKIKKLGKKATCFDTFPEIEKFLLKNFFHGEMLITMGAGDIVKVGENMLKL